MRLYIKNLCALSLFIPVALAEAQGVAYEPAVIYVGPLDVTPELVVEVRDDDNIFQEASGSETASTLTIVRPRFDAVLDNGITVFNLEYEMEDGGYSDTDNSDYTDHMFSLGLDWQADVRHAFEFGSSLKRSHDGRSPDSVTGIGLAELNEF